MMTQRTVAPEASTLPAIIESLVMLAVSWTFTASVELSGIGEIFSRSKVHANAIFASAFISTMTLWMRCGDDRLRSFRNREHAQYEGGDLDGLTMGSVLMPLLLSSSSCIYALSYGSNEETHICNAVDSYALVSVLAGFYFAVASCVRTALQKLILMGHERFISRFVLAVSTELATAAMALCATCVFLVYEVLSSANGQDSSSLCVGVVACLVQAASLMWYASPVFQIGKRSVSTAVRTHSSSKTAYTTSQQTTLHLNKIFTAGEWMVVSSILTTGCVDFCVRYLSFFDTKFNPMPPYLAVAHSGFIGCLFGCAVSSIWPRSQKKKGDAWLLCSSKFIIVVVSTIGFVEKALRRSCAYHRRMCPHLDRTNTTLVGMRVLPSSLGWLGDFLSMPDPGHSSSWLHGFPYQQRLVWLLYWLVVLAALSPVAIILAVKLKEMADSPRKRRCKVAARKFFHFVAVILFLPATYGSPTMMSLSYAIASALLVLVETLRLTVARTRSLTSDQISSPANRSWRIALSINNFYEAFFDEKDVGAKGGGFVVTHAALVFGCAMPLWIKEMLYQPWQLPQGHEGIGEQMILLQLLPVVGVLALGVGDAAGALVGVYCGRTKWPGSRRTVEGSFGMMFSMLALVAVMCFRTSILQVGNATQLILLLAALTILEAFTSQIDNIYLPLAGIAMILIGILTQYQH